MNFYKHYIGDFQRDTGHLSLTERGAYLCLIHHYYATEKPLPNDVDSLCRIAGAVSKIDRAAVKVAMSFFEKVDSGLMHARIEAELEKAGEISNTNRTIALAREEKRRAAKAARIDHEQSTLRAQSVPRIDHEQSTNQTPDTINTVNPPERVNNLTSGTAAGSVCSRLKKECRIADVNPQNPKLLALLGAGLTEDEIIAAGIDSKVKSFAYILSMAEGRRRDANNITKLPTAVPKSPAPENFETRDYGKGGRI